MPNIRAALYATDDLTSTPLATAAGEFDVDGDISDLASVIVADVLDEAPAINSKMVVVVSFDGEAERHPVPPTLDSQPPEPAPPLSGLYGRTREAWEAFHKQAPDIHNLSAAAQLLEKEARLLEFTLAAAFKPLIEQWCDGLISSSDFFMKLAYEALKETAQEPPSIIEQKIAEQIEDDLEIGEWEPDDAFSQDPRDAEEEHEEFLKKHNMSADEFEDALEEHEERKRQRIAEANEY